jgi:sugar/nucleoside kinase (ribokinase family)
VKARLHAEFELLVIGELNADLLYGEVITPAFGQAEKLVDDAVLTVGSPSAIFAHQAACLGLGVAFAGKVGADTFGEFMARRLREAGIDTSGVMVDPSLKTGLTVHLVRGAVRAMLTHPGAMTALRTEEIDERLLRSSRHVHLGSYFLQESIQPGLPRLFARAREAGATTSLDPNWDPAERWDSSIREVLRETDVFLRNGQELLAIAGKAATEAALEEFADIPTIVVKRGSAGAVGYEGGGGLRASANGACGHHWSRGWLRRGICIRVTEGIRLGACPQCGLRLRGTLHQGTRRRGGPAGLGALSVVR